MRKGGESIEIIEEDRSWRRIDRDHRADSARLPSHFPPQDRQTVTRRREERVGKEGAWRETEGKTETEMENILVKEENKKTLPDMCINQN